MPSYDCSVEVLPNVWIGTKHALRDATFRNHNYIIRDVIFDSPYASLVEPLQTTKTAVIQRIPLTGREDALRHKEIESILFPFLDESLNKDRGLLVSGESWNSPHLMYVARWCAARSDLDVETAESHIRNQIPHSDIPLSVSHR